MKKRFWIRKAAMFITIALVFITAFTFIVMALWNAILPEVINVKEISFWQALGILALSKILFGGFHRGWSHRRQAWRQKMSDKWATMTPEEREKFKAEWKTRCGRWGRFQDQTPISPTYTAGSDSE